MEGQLSLFDFIPSNKFCWDEDINEIIEKLDALVSKYQYEKSKTEFEVWDHVPNLGYRLTYTIRVPRAINNEFWDGMEEIVKNSKKRNIELSPIVPHFCNNEETGMMMIFSMFLDNRQKVKKGQVA